MADKIKAPCIMCARVTAHHVLATQDRSDEDIADRYYSL